LALRTCAQDAVGSLEGHVFDTSGAVIRSATISLTDLATNAKRTRNPDNDGLYRFVELGVSSYSLSVDAAGFAHFSQAPIEITISQTSRVDVSLAVGSTTQSVSISDAPAAIDTSTNTLARSSTAGSCWICGLTALTSPSLDYRSRCGSISSGVLTGVGSLRQRQS
jgi:hypothetical protein